MTAQQLKNSILQMAVQGKLVPQDPGDEPASVLLRRIKAEKQELIKAGKIKKDKKSSEIFRGATHNLPYAFCEQIGKEIRDISDDIPFEIPESWEWVRLSSICTKLVDGDHNPPKGEKSTTQYYMLSSTNINHNTLVELNKVRYLNKEIFEKENSRTKVSVGDVFFTSVGSLGRSCVFQGGHNICFQRSVTVISTLIYNYYLKYFFDNPFFQDKIVREATGTAQKGFYLNQLSECIIPLPPLSEQHRIVAKIEQLLPFIEKYEQAETQLTALNTSFPEMLKKSILQESVQGKLVPQNPFDEPASVLLERIRAKKQELIKQGKIKKDKHESAIITRDKIPYEIPDSWVWCKLSDLAILENGDRSSKYPVEADYVEIGIPFFGAKDIDGDMMSFQNVRFISQQKYDELGNGKLVDGDIICLLRGSVGKTAKFEANEQFDTGFICAQMLIIRLLDKSLFGYISSYFKSPDYTNYVESKVTGTAVRQMPAKEMGNLLIPLPPLAEQHRIVAKIEEIMPMIERLTLR
ncbi:Type I restriction enzyme EcoKI specificity protein [uncultured Ruminococcus sp.]|uniref:Restriction endonuclease subunit S n=1 Tax=Hominimerdicola aceti TaxID=2981726 RepID=A0AAE3II23_9FIRM|nr:restriction endonuclease subunit S [Hominimerdicola aceti]MCU6705742.1 restriction endonuclease subunit S [Hominimerdicola aceti]SCI72549.1 Type I restriction enzyme EcoKI specificity protein [uncultured Ruminococcus sp.]